MHDKILLSTAYLPPVSYFSIIDSPVRVYIEKNENYVKQSYRNRCYILSPHGRQLLVVPVLEGSRHKIKITDVRIDYSKRWQQVHLRAMISAYKNSPYFDFYFEEIDKIISAGYEYLWELNNSLFNFFLRALRIESGPLFTTTFEEVRNMDYDFRYRLTPDETDQSFRKYTQVFFNIGFVPDLSIIDLLFNMGPDAPQYLH